MEEFSNFKDNNTQKRVYLLFAVGGKARKHKFLELQTKKGYKQDSKEISKLLDNNLCK